MRLVWALTLLHHSYQDEGLSFVFPSVNVGFRGDSNHHTIFTPATTRFKTPTRRTLRPLSLICTLVWWTNRRTSCHYGHYAFMLSHPRTPVFTDLNSHPLLRSSPGGVNVSPPRRVRAVHR